jgi:D-xylose 1-dehydrogenase (NADP+, D-xylono-1,5-lactone-forming)
MPGAGIHENVGRPTIPRRKSRRPGRVARTSAKARYDLFIRSDRVFFGRGYRFHVRGELTRLEATAVGELSGIPKLRCGILGCARIARRGLIPGIQGSTSGSLQALASRDLTTARAWAEEFAVPKAYGSYRELVHDSEIDAIYIPLPNELHKPWVLAAADAGKHVLCEKPLALDAREAAEIVGYCRDRGVILMEAFMWRHQPRSLRLRTLVSEGAIGRLRLIRSSFSFPIESGDWRLDPARGGGALWDVGCYGVSTARFFAGSEPTSWQSIAHRGETAVDLTLTALLEFANGILATIDCSFEQPFRCTYELVGTQGVIEVPDAYLPPATGKALARLRTIGAVSDAGAGADQVETLEFDQADQYAAMVDAFAQTTKAGRLIDPAEDGLAQMAVLDRLRGAALASPVGG